MAEASAVARRLVWWLVPFAIVVAALGFETDWGRSLDQVAPVRATAPAQPVTVALMPEYRLEGGLDARKDTVDRVLFNPTRRPAPPATQTATGPSSMKRGQFTLTGTTVVGNTATAFLREVNGGKARSVRKGETLNGMTVAEVTTDRVRLKQGDEFEDLQLKIAAGPRTTVQSPIRWSDDADWKLDYNNLARMSPEEVARRRAEFDKGKEVAKKVRIDSGVAARPAE